MSNAIDQAAWIAKIAAEKYTPKQVIPMLKEAGASAEDIASVLKSAFDLDAKAAATALKMLGGFGASAVAGALKSAYDLSGDAAKTALHAAGFAQSAISDALKSVFDIIPHVDLPHVDVLPHADLF